MVAFYYILDSARVNSTTLLALKNKQDPRRLNSFDTGFELATALVRPHILRQPKNGLQKNILNKISVFLGEEANVALPADGNLFQKLADTRKNCKKCLQDIAGIDYKAKKAK